MKIISVLYTEHSTTKGKEREVPGEVPGEVPREIPGKVPAEILLEVPSVA